MPQMDSVADPTLIMPNSGSSPRAYRDEDDEDDNPYASGPRLRMSNLVDMVGHLAKQISDQAGKDIQQNSGKNTGQPSRHGMLPIRSLWPLLKHSRKFVRFLGTRGKQPQLIFFLQKQFRKIFLRGAGCNDKYYGLPIDLSSHSYIFGDGDRT